MKKSCRKIIFFLTLLSFLSLAIQPAASQLQYTDEQIDQILRWQDHQIFNYFNFNYLADYRYNYFLNTIMNKMNPYLPEIFGSNASLNISGYSFASSLGFNAVTGYRMMIFDSLLLDTLKFLSDGIVVYGGVDNEYVHALAKAVVNLCAAHQQGFIRPNTQDLVNPFSLPYLTGLTEQQRYASKLLFTDMVASWVAHEGSHAFLEHIREKMKISATMQSYNTGKYPPEVFQQQINNYLTYTLGPQKELEADEKATILLIKSGYAVDGFLWWLEFADILEELMGTKSSYVRTHPSSEGRIKIILKTKNQLLQQTPIH